MPDSRSLHGGVSVRYLQPLAALPSCPAAGFFAGLAIRLVRTARCCLRPSFLIHGVRLKRQAHRETGVLTGSGQEQTSAGPQPAPAGTLNASDSDVQNRWLTLPE